MFFLWALVTIWLAAAVLLPVYMLFSALFRKGYRIANDADRKHYLRVARGY
jgi:hypothetical protein